MPRAISVRTATHHRASVWSRIESCFPLIGTSAPSCLCQFQHIAAPNTWRRRSRLNKFAGSRGGWLVQLADRACACQFAPTGVWARSSEATTSEKRPGRAGRLPGYLGVAVCSGQAAFSRTCSGNGNGLFALFRNSTVMKTISLSPIFCRSWTLNSPGP